MDNFCNFACDVAVGYGQFIHAGRIHSYSVGYCAGRAVAQNHFRTARSVVKPPIKFARENKDEA